MDFKVGDRVRATKDCYPIEVGKEYTVEYYPGTTVLAIFDRNKSDKIHCSCINTWVKINSPLPNGAAEKKSLMSNILDQAKKLALKVSDPGEYALRQSGIHDETGNLTESGKELLLAHLETEADAKAHLVDIATQIVAEQESK
jgi:hypothetical protein